MPSLSSCWVAIGKRSNDGSSFICKVHRVERSGMVPNKYLLTIVSSQEVLSSFSVPSKRWKPLQLLSACGLRLELIILKIFVRKNTKVMVLWIFHTQNTNKLRSCPFQKRQLENYFFSSSRAIVSPFSEKKSQVAICNATIDGPCK